MIKSCEAWNLHPQLSKNLKSSGVASFFPVQLDVVPLLLNYNSRQCVYPRDMCVSAPTGSGKTLSYAVPIVQLLMNVQVTRLRALVILPNRELANQVFGVFAGLSKDTSVKIALATGKSDFAEEQRILVGNKLAVTNTQFSNQLLFEMECDGYGCSNVDILVCTPGRLLEHLENTPNFTLAHLCYLILDEADKLLGNSYHSWVHKLITDSNDYGFDSNATELTMVRAPCSRKAKVQKLLFSATLSDNPAKLALLGIRNPVIIKSGINTNVQHVSIAQQNASVPTEAAGEKVHESSTMAPIAKRSVMLDADTSAAGAAQQQLACVLPQSLSESVRVCDTSERPVVLLAVLCEVFQCAQFVTTIISSDAPCAQLPDQKDDFDNDNDNDNNNNVHATSKIAGPPKLTAGGDVCLIFTSSVETTHRLCRLLQLFNGQGSGAAANSCIFQGRVAEISSLIRADEREQVLRDARAGEVRVIVSSDHMARGIDLAGVKLVINYDPPKLAKGYVHRAGRTARASRLGHCLTLLKMGQVGAFRKMRNSIGGRQDTLAAESNNIPGSTKRIAGFEATAK